jgi:CubicO group peptidase (beta-lactamase class C family)
MLAFRHCLKLPLQLPLTLLIAMNVLLGSSTKLPLSAQEIAKKQGVEAAAGLPSVPPETVGLSPKGLAEITRYVQGEVEAGRIAGAVVMLARHGNLAYAEAIGSAQLPNADQAEGRPMRRDSLFRIASMTKAITSVAVMQLVEEELIALDDVLAKYIPELEQFAVLGEQTEVAGPTIHQLLTHTSGITYGWFGPEELDRAYRQERINQLFTPVQESLAERVPRLRKIPLVCKPGTAWNYGYSTDVLGRVVEVASGMPLDVYCRERIFRPLGMKDTFFKVPPDELSRTAALYTVDDNLNLQEVDSQLVTKSFLEFSANYCTDPSGLYWSGGSGLVATADDYMRLLLALAGGGKLGENRILRPETIKIMTQNRIGDLQVSLPGHGDGFGYGFGVVTDRGAEEDIVSVGSYSWGGIFNTYFWVDPQEELVGLLMTQLFPFDHLDLRQRFKQLAYDSLDDSGFSKIYWYQPGIESGNPVFNSRNLRVSSPGASVHPRYAERVEPRSSGTATILIEEDLRETRRAEIYCELWGGHPGTANKRLTINGRSSYGFPDVGSHDEQCTHQYAKFSARVDDLVNGYNRLQFACDQGTTFWGHYIVDNCALLVGAPRTDPRIETLVGSDFSVALQAQTLASTESIRLGLTGSASSLAAIDRVDYVARYYGYDENGANGYSDWHGMTKGREAYGHVGTSREAPFQLDWDTRMLPAQSQVKVRAQLHFREDPSWIYQTPPVGDLEIASREMRSVEIFTSPDLPKPFWSRAGRKKTCTIDLPLVPSSIEACQLHVVAWTGGSGGVTDYFTLNGQHFPIAEASSHQVLYSVMDVPVKLLKAGKNQFELHSTTEHHGIEILAPGPALVVRYTGSAKN